MTTFESLQMKNYSPHKEKIESFHFEFYMVVHVGDIAR